MSRTGCRKRTNETCHRDNIVLKGWVKKKGIKSHSVSPFFAKHCDQYADMMQMCHQVILSTHRSSQHCFIFIFFAPRSSGAHSSSGAITVYHSKITKTKKLNMTQQCNKIQSFAVNDNGEKIDLDQFEGNGVTHKIRVGYPSPKNQHQHNQG